MVDGSQRMKLKNLRCLAFCPADVPIRDPNIKENSFCCKEDFCNAAVPTGGIQGLVHVKKHHQATHQHRALPRSTCLWWGSPGDEQSMVIKFILVRDILCILQQPE
ncbi:uncharacterized protein LOC110288453 [Mus caroli]|uniref:Uncharacterized protein LOC110288453 n=1 Tax=Mus caroli TaxID=10089 RepID=A0A6P5P8G4_MUSCR|nr:uncharacterized protein LOC110288453 [Mus caroli]